MRTSSMGGRRDREGVMKVLSTGGAGYIGSTIGLACRDKGWDVVVLDDLSTGREEFTTGTSFYVGDIADQALVARIFAEHPDIGAVVHCAAKIVVPDSVADPIAYYRNNVAKTIELLDRLGDVVSVRSEEHTSELQSRDHR